MIRARRLRPRQLPQLFRRHRGAAFGLEALTAWRAMSSIGAVFPARPGRLGAGARGRGRGPAGRPARRAAEIRLARRQAVHAAPGASRAAQRPAGAMRSPGSAPPMSSSASSSPPGPTWSATTSRVDLAPAAGPAWRPSRWREAVAADRGLARPHGRRPLCQASASRSPPPRSPRSIRPRSRRDGERRKVAVKVIRPGVRQRFARDLESYFLAARLQERYIPPTRRLRPVEVTDTLAQTTTHRDGPPAGGGRPLGARREHQGRSRLPRAGGRLGAHRPRRAHHGVDRRHQDVATSTACAPPATTSRRSPPTLIQSFLRHTLRDGFFHADMHPGNLFVDADGDIVAVDLGIIGRLGKKERRFLAEILYGFITPRLPARRRSAFRGRLRAAHSTMSPPSPRRSAPSASRSTASRPRPSRWPSC